MFEIADAEFELKFKNKKWLNQYGKENVMEMVKVFQFFRNMLEGLWGSLISNSNTKLENSKWLTNMVNGNVMKMFKIFFDFSEM